ncbi:MAG: hypothetical protein ACRDTH_13810 [Pseudonocardiaceae bacterium]
MADTVALLLRRSLAHLASEVPASYRHLQHVLGPLVIELDVDGELFALRGGPRLEVVEGTAPMAGARITIPRAAIIDVLDARVALAEAVESNRIAVRGSLDDVLRAHDTLIAYAHAAVRAPSAPGLLAELRTGTEQVR